MLLANKQKELFQIVIPVCGYKVTTHILAAWTLPNENRYNFHQGHVEERKELFSFSHARVCSTLKVLKKAMKNERTITVGWICCRGGLI